MLIGVFMAIFLVAVLYYTIGIGEALNHRQRMQDAADAAALSAAVVHARGMNVIVLINIIMAALLAVIVALKLIETLIIAAMALITVMSFFTGGGLAGTLPELETLRRTANKEAEEAKKVVFPQLRRLHKTARGVRDIVPAAAEMRVLDTVIGHYNPPAHTGFVIPKRWTLPTANDRFGVLCEKAGKNVGSLLGMPFKHLGGELGDTLASAIREASGSCSASLSNWFCGDGEPNFDSVKLNYTEKLPVLVPRKACIEYGKKIRKSEYSKTKHQQICQAAERAEEDSLPDSTDGMCRYRAHPDEQTKCASYYQLVKEARRQCNPKTNDKLKKYRWQEQTIRVYYRYEGIGKGWVKHQQVLESILRQTNKSPCNAKNWNEDVGHIEHNNGFLVCRLHDSDKCDKLHSLVKNTTDLSRGIKYGDTTRSCKYTAVSQIIGCERPAKRSLVPKQKNEDELTRNDKSTRKLSVPQKIEDKLGLGDDDFQMRAVVVGYRGSKLENEAKRILEIVGRKEEKAALTKYYSDIAVLGQLSVAQAEYYYAGSEDRQEWMWHMYWRARLKRFRLSRLSKDKDTRPAPQKSIDRLSIGTNEELPKNIKQAYSSSQNSANKQINKANNNSNIKNIDKYINLLDSFIAH